MKVAAPVDDPPPPKDLPGKKAYIPPYTPNIDQIKKRAADRPPPPVSRPTNYNRPRPTQSRPINQPRPGNSSTSSSRPNQQQQQQIRKHRPISAEEELEVESK